MKINYHKQMETEIERVKSLGEKPTLLLHSCCAPCSTRALSVLKGVFSVTVFYYNPSIYPIAEYDKRLEEQKKLCKMLEIPLIEGEFTPEKFYSAVKGLENLPEGDKRCKICLADRLSVTAQTAKEKGFEYFTTTLTTSPLKDAEFINETGKTLSKNYGVKFLESDFKKKDGYLESIRLSKEYSLYRQNYCGCEFSIAKDE